MNGTIRTVSALSAVNLVVADGLQFAEQLGGAPQLEDMLSQVVYAAHHTCTRRLTRRRSFGTASSATSPHRTGDHQRMDAVRELLLRPKYPGVGGDVAAVIARPRDQPRDRDLGLAATVLAPPSTAFPPASP